VSSYEPECIVTIIGCLNIIVAGDQADIFYTEIFVLVVAIGCTYFVVAYGYNEKKYLDIKSFC